MSLHTIQPKIEFRYHMISRNSSTLIKMKYPV